jgi:hypothetical protein
VLANEGSESATQTSSWSSLSWGAPGWVGAGNYFSQDSIDYHIKWLKGANATHGLEMDYFGMWNEHTASTDWIVRLRQAMDAAGFSAVKIVATNEGGWPACGEMIANKTVMDAIDVVGSHYPIQGSNSGAGRNFSQAKPLPYACQQLQDIHNKSMVTSEGYRTWLT